MRYYSDSDFRLGALTNPDPARRRKAIDLTRRGLDALAEMGGSLMTLWLGQDGFDYPIQADYGRMWDDTIAALDVLAGHNRGNRHRARVQAGRAPVPFADAGCGHDPARHPRGGSAEPRSHPGFRARPLRRRDAGARRGPGESPLAAARHPAQRWVREARRRPDGGRGASGPDRRASGRAAPMRLLPGDLLRHLIPIPADSTRWRSARPISRRSSGCGESPRRLRRTNTSHAQSTATTRRQASGSWPRLSTGPDVG